MKLVLENARLVNSLVAPVMGPNGHITAKFAEILFIGGKIRVENGKSIPNGEYASISVETELLDQAKSWRAKDGRSGAMIAQEVRFGDVIEVLPLKK